MSRPSSRSPDDTLVRLVLLVLAVVVLLPLVTMGLAMPFMGGMGWGWHGSAMTGSWWGLGLSLVWLVVLAGLGYVVYRAMVGGAGAERDPALAELRLAYARGDLTDEEFAARRAVLAEDRDAEA